ncbi:uncharacterized protein LOC129581140 [Paramacrobiotus metropolitanus]|uniref:uncharacterized protein LOC129581140 n=1 Tax=Paramacrobiotus metropolitanus TaxID=2943436 RepID=UPI0024461D11|nr:uncharacterized protein LOC129581140 [Paramacrobiotus metropolitanus]
MVLGSSAKETEPDTSDDEGVDGTASATLQNSADNKASRKSDIVRICTSQPSVPIFGTDNSSREGNGADGVDPILEALKPIITSNNNLPKTAVALGERFANLSGELLQDACAKCYEKIPQLGCASESTAASSSLSNFFSCSTCGLHFHEACINVPSMNTRHGKKQQVPAEGEWKCPFCATNSRKRAAKNTGGPRKK